MVLTHRMLAGAILAVGLTLTGCSSDGDRPAPPAADSGAALNSATAQSVVDAIVAADLAAPNAHDDTAQRCPKIGCLQAVTTDTVTVLKFPSTGTALRHLGQLPDGYGIEDFVVVFDPAVPAEQRTRYQRAISGAVR
ncbi:hypothetical protein [Mycolicibacterium fallax]|uniref:Uncharacterized protein n=1 Tax=Mycolicibacterium fallax TaxID=1793 RepID=A0A1X1RIE5_MYCFA|nr:hypothetical protein [Mycolicibacterium fallax]ORV06860.1 hypothetical protein AWC04_05355 [Mycolicibacterium fallax]BBY96846.1 hypothetical protein MFAL_03130 [Mycolicibacterium fallax]